MELARLIEPSVGGSKIVESNNGIDLDRRDYAVSYEKIRKVGFKANISLQDGIDELLKIIPNMSPNEVLRCKNI